MDNFSLNPELEKKIILVNKGVSDKKETITINYDSEGDGSASYYKNNSDYMCSAETTTIKDILEDFNIENPYLLKMDCEGCEVPVIFNSDLSSFQKIIFEHHKFLTNVKYQKLLEKLEKQGFELKQKTGNKDIGVLHLDKKDNL